jgi:hypothetical protein
MTIQLKSIQQIIEELYGQVAIRRKIITDELIGDLYPRIVQGEIEKILDSAKDLERPNK